MDKNIIGKTVTVIVDRPLKTCHPNYPEIVYKVIMDTLRGYSHLTEKNRMHIF